MRLPALEELEADEEQLLRSHDVAELHCGRSTAYATSYLRRLEVTIEAVQRWSPKGLILDAACAQGNLAITLAALGLPTVGIDLRPPFLDYARRKDDSSLVSWVAGSLEALPFQAEAIGCIVLGEVLEHVAHPERLLEQAARILVPGGIVVATTPNGDKFHTGLPNLADIPARAALEARQFQPDADGHLFLLTKDELVLVGTAAGLEFLDHKYIQTPFLTGWPRLQRQIEFIPVGFRRRLNRRLEAMWVSSRVSNGQIVVFRR